MISYLIAFMTLCMIMRELIITIIMTVWFMYVVQRV